MELDEALLYLSGWIFLGSGLGGVLRFLCSGLVARTFGETFPWGTLLVNVSGSFLIGLFAVVSGPDGRLLVGSMARQFVMVGIFGGYTRSPRSVCRRSTWRGTGSGGWSPPTSPCPSSSASPASWLGFAAGVAVNR